MKTAYIVGGYRSAVGKAPRGMFKTMRADDLSADVIRHLLKDFPQLDHNRIDDVIVGNATPEAEQGLNIGRMVSLMGLDTEKVPGMTVNRYCSSGLQTIALASWQIQSGAADCIIAGGVETMTPIPFGGWRLVPNAKVGKENPDWYWGMGLTAEAVAKEYKVSREDQDAFALKSHDKALDAISSGRFKDDIVPITVNEVYLDENEKRQERSFIADTDEGPRAGSTLEGLAKLRPVFAQGGSVTAANSSRLVSFSVAALEPRIMGMGPKYAIPKALKQAGLKLEDLEQIELNEAFASQSIAVINELGLNPDIINVNGGAIAMGHPLGCTGAKLSVQLFNEMRRRDQKYGAVTMCVGTGQGACGIFEFLK